MPSFSEVSERAARIDGLLTQLGGQGSNLREKASSLAGRLSPQTISDLQQLDYLRENALQGGLSDVEMERFTRLADAATGELQGLGRAPQVAYTSAQTMPPMSEQAAGPAPAGWDTPPAMPMRAGGVPEKLKYVTIPLLILFVMQLLGLLILPFLGPLMNAAFGAASADPQSGLSAQDVGMLKMFTGATLWISFLIGALWAAFIFMTYRAVGQGKNWARIAAIVLGVLNLLNFPIGTILGIFILIGALDQDVQRYASR